MAERRWDSADVIELWRPNRHLHLDKRSVSQAQLTYFGALQMPESAAVEAIFETEESERKTEESDQ